MSISIPLSNQSIAVDQDAEQEELVTAVVQLAEEVSDLRAELGDLREDNAELEDEVANLRDDHADHVEDTARERANDRQRLTDIEDTVEEQESQRSDPTLTPEPEEPAQKDSLTPIERLSEGDRQDVAANITPSVERALALFEHLPDWGTQTPKGITLRPDDRPKDLLEAATGESLAWQQYYRACEALESLSKGAVTFVETNRHGKTLVFHDDTGVHQRATTSNHGDSQPSLVAD